MNIFRSKEIYKRIPGVSPTLNPVRITRGVWVSGEHRPPYCIDGTIHVTDISSNKPEIREYTQMISNARASGNVGLVDINFSSFSYETYTISEESTKAQPGNVALVDINFSDFAIYNYSQKEETSRFEGHVALVDCNFSELSYEDHIYNLPTYDSQPEPTVVINAFSSNDVVIENA